MDDYESVLLVKPEVFVYMIPPRTTNRAQRAADWNLSKPDWTGRMRIVVKNGKCSIKLEDKLSGDLFAKGPVDKYPGVALETVSDSSRYFVLRIEDESGKAAFIGVGFGDRSDSFDVNVALQDHFKWVRKEEEAADAGAEGSEKQPALDLGFKEGQTIKINMKITKKDGQESNSSKPKPKSAGAGLGILPPPPAAVKLPPPSPQRNPTSNLDLLANNGPSGAENESWGEFATARASASDSSPNTSAPSKEAKNPGWVTF